MSIFTRINSKSDMKLFAIFAMILAMSLTGCHHSHYSKSAEANGSFSTIVLPSLPDELYFAGEDVPLQYIDVREALQRELLVTCYMHSRTMLTLLNTERYFNMIEPILEKYGIPEDFKYLCVAESGLNPEIVSPAGAAGLWQFMPHTAEEYGMMVGNQIDERYDVEKSTEAACKYLIEAYEQFGSWTLAAASYNVGRNGVQRRLNAQHTSCYYDTFLPQETMRYIYRILSLKLVCSNPQAYGFTIKPKYCFKPLDGYRVVQVTGEHIYWSDVAIHYGTNYKILRLFNPWIRAYEYNNPRNLTFDVKVPSKRFRTRG